MFRATFKERAIAVKVLNIATRAERERLHRVGGLDLKTPKQSFMPDL